MSRSLLWAVMCAVSLIAAAPQDSRAASAYEIDVGVDETLERFYYSIRGARELAHKAVGVLVFPSVVKAGFGFCVSAAAPSTTTIRFPRRSASSWACRSAR
jgi:lipid-binding SYLF domain-containing protein